MEKGKYKLDSRTTAWRKKKLLRNNYVQPPTEVVSCPCDLHEQAKVVEDHRAGTSADNECQGFACSETMPISSENCKENSAVESSLSNGNIQCSHLEVVSCPCDLYEQAKVLEEQAGTSTDNECQVFACSESMPISSENGKENLADESFSSSGGCSHAGNVMDVMDEYSCAEGCSDTKYMQRGNTDSFNRGMGNVNPSGSVHNEITSYREEWNEIITEDDSVRPSSGFSPDSSDGDYTSITLSVSDADSDDISSLSDLDSYEAHFLEEDPHNEQNLADDQQPNINNLNNEDGFNVPEGEQDEPENPGDPENPDDPGDGIAEDAYDDDEQVANFANEELLLPLVLQNHFTKADVLLIFLAIAMRHKKSFECILDEFRSLNLFFGHKFFPGSKDKLYEIIQLNKVGITSHVYCKKKECGEYIGKRDTLGPVAVCQSCNDRTLTTKASFFVSLGFRKQLKRFLNIPGMWVHLQHRLVRQKRSPTAVEDIYDGAHYKDLQKPGGPLESPYNFSYVFNTDGCKPSKKGKVKVWPIFVRINELPPSMRQKFHILVGLYVDKCDPHFQSFLEPFVEEANSLSTIGIVWKPNGVDEVRSTFTPFCHCVDAPARSGILQMVPYNSHFGCTYCNHEGQHAAGSMRYPPFLENGEPAFEDRTHAGMIQDMLQARAHPEHMGHKGLTQLMLLENYDLRKGQAADDLHPDHEGCAKHITDLLLTEAPRVQRRMYQVDLIQIINRRLLSIKTPSRISRKPSPITGSFNGTEWRNWLLFYGPPCLDGLISPEYINLFSALSHGCYLLSQDSIELNDLNEADRLLKSFATNLQQKFGIERMRFNVHATTAHKVTSVRDLGPPWAYSTYNFESLNSQLMKLITSPKGSITQVVTRYLMQQAVTCAMYDEDVPEQVRERLHHIMSKRKLQRVRQVGLKIYAVGKATNRAPTHEERELFNREGIHILQLDEYKSFLKEGTRFWSSNYRDEDIKSDDSFIYTYQDTFCTIERVILFQDDVGEEHFGLVVTEHDVARSFDVACHISILRNDDANLMHYIDVKQVRSPAIKMTFDGVSYAVPLHNCHEID